MDIPIEIGDGKKRAIFKLDLDPSRQHDAFLLAHYESGNCYESEVVWVMLKALRPGDTAVDVGANLGFFTVLMSRLVGDKGSVIAVEPEYANRAKLCYHIALNGVANTSIISNPLAREIGPVKFWINSDDGSSSALWDVGRWHENVKSKADPKPVEHRATTLDAIVNRPVRLIKIDVEGAEESILRGGEDLLNSADRPPFIIAELNPFGMKEMGGDADTFRDFMSACGYDMFFLHAAGQLPTFVPRGVKIKYGNDVQVKNVLFSSIDEVAKAWGEASE